MIIIKLLGNLKLSGTAVQHFFGEGKKVMTSGGLLEIGKVTTQKAVPQCATPPRYVAVRDRFRTAI